jgi:hypothetical protein
VVELVAAGAAVVVVPAATMGLCELLHAAAITAQPATSAPAA